MAQTGKTIGRIADLFSLLAVATWLTACTTTRIAPPTLAETLPDAITIPYRISRAGHFVIDIEVNGGPPQSFIVDTGANMSAIYEENIQSLNLAEEGQSVMVRGLVTVGLRPTFERIKFQIGTQDFSLSRIAVLETPLVNDGTMGLLGADVFSDYTIVFNKLAMTATFVPSKYTQSSTFSGWRRIPLRKRIGPYADNGLHFAQTTLNGEKVAVLVDTGSNLNIVNWPLATLDEGMRRFQRRLRDRQKLQGAMDTAPLRIETVFYSIALGRHYWPESTVIVMDLDTLSAIAPVDEPMMIAGAGMFTPWTVAFDFGGDMLYILANPDDPGPPSQDKFINQSRFALRSINEQID